MTITNSTLSDNSTSTQGGAIENDTIDSGGTQTHGRLTIINSIVADNAAEFSGGIATGNNTPLTVSDSTISGNTATDSGGGISNDEGPVTVTNSTLSGNSATHGGGISNTDATMNVTATIVANSATGADCSGGITDDGFNLDDDASCGFIAPTDLSNTPALRDPTGPQNNGGPTLTVALEPGSPAIGHVTDPPLCARADQRGVSRSTPCDIGAYETSELIQMTTFVSSPPSPALVGGPTYSVSATASSGLPVTLTADGAATAVCSVSGGSVAFTTVGKCTIDANHTGDGNYAPAPEVQQSFNVGPNLSAITSTDTARGTVGASFSFTVTTSGASMPVITKRGKLPKNLQFVTNSDGTATISGTPQKRGATHLKIKATFGEGRTKYVVTQSFTLTVTR